MGIVVMMVLAGEESRARSLATDGVGEQVGVAVNGLEHGHASAIGHYDTFLPRQGEVAPRQR
ncbi:hypothetical protein SAQ01S_36370 [Sphingomonas aquatilis NBRC 16722]|nr:hypothetical protein SAQ01S_36370 [Sphingomonas aquatilis NBRC 16722]